MAIKTQRDRRHYQMLAPRAMYFRWNICYNSTFDMTAFVILTSLYSAILQTQWWLLNWNEVLGHSVKWNLYLKEHSQLSSTTSLITVFFTRASSINYWQHEWKVLEFKGRRSTLFIFLISLLLSWHLCYQVSNLIYFGLLSKYLLIQGMIILRSLIVGI